jgi:hypothetical protein
MSPRGRISNARKEEMTRWASEMEQLSGKVNTFLKGLDLVIKLDPGSVWYVADTLDRDWCISPRLTDLEALHKWVSDNYRRLQIYRAEQRANHSK